MVDKPILKCTILCKWGRGGQMVTGECYSCSDRDDLGILHRLIVLKCQSVIGKMFTLVVKNRALFKI